MVYLLTLGIFAAFLACVGLIVLAGWGLSVLMEVDVPVGVLFVMIGGTVIFFLVSTAYTLALKLLC